MPEPPPSQLSRLLKEHPRERPRFARAVASLLGAGLVALGAIGFLVVWHLIRRGRLIREGLSPPRKVRLPEIEPTKPRPDAVEERGSGPS